MSEDSFLHIVDDTARRVSDTIGQRYKTHGDPEVFGDTFAALVNAYIRPIILSGRAIGALDCFVILDLMKSARIACGGPLPEHFHDKAGYAVLGEAAATRLLERAKATSDEPELPFGAQPDRCEACGAQEGEACKAPPDTLCRLVNGDKPISSEASPLDARVRRPHRKCQMCGAIEGGACRSVISGPCPHTPAQRG